MVPPDHQHRENHQNQLNFGYGGYMTRIYDYTSVEERRGSENLAVHRICENSKSMAEDDSRTNSLNNAAASSNNTNNNNVNNNEEQTSSDWLQLSIGNHTVSQDIIKHHHRQFDRTVTLDLLPPAATTASPPPRPLMTISGFSFLFIFLIL